MGDTVNEFFVVWLTTASAFGFTAKAEFEAACQLASDRNGTVFVLRDRGYRHAMICGGEANRDCNFPGWLTIPVHCVLVPDKQVVEPQHWEQSPRIPVDQGIIDFRPSKAAILHAIPVDPSRTEVIR